MAYYSYKDFTSAIGVSKPTLLKYLKEKGYEKTTPGRYFDEKEAESIAKLLNFTLIPKK